MFPLPLTGFRQPPVEHGLHAGEQLGRHQCLMPPRELLALVGDGPEVVPVA